MIYIQLFLSFLQIGLFSVGGGYAAIPLVQSLIVERQGWITLPWWLCDGKYFRQSSPSGSGADRRCRTFDATGSSSSRGKWGEDDPVGQSGSFFGSFYSAPQMETEPNSCDVGLRRCQPGS